MGLREATCIFKSIGCTAEVTHQSLAPHLEDCTQSHLMLMLNTVVEQQDVIKSLCGRVYDLESRAKALESWSVASARVEERVTVTEQSMGKLAELDKKITHVEKRTIEDTKRVFAGASAEAKRCADAAAGDAKKRSESAVASVRSELVETKKHVDMHTKYMNSTVKP